MLEALQEQSTLQSLTADHANRALDDLLDSAQQVTRSLLGVGNDSEELPGGGIGSLSVHRPGIGWTAMPSRYHG